jgi:lipid-A-disaccharide synthase
MVAQAYNFPDYQFVIAGVSNLPKELYARWQSIFPIKVVYDDAYNLLSVADAALVTSGTATLETALLNVPQVVCYKTSGVSFAIAKMVIKVPYISLVNLVAQKKIVPELIQSDLNNITVQEELKKILTPEGRQAQLEGYAEVRALLGDKGASAKAGSLMVDYLLK